MGRAPGLTATESASPVHHPVQRVHGQGRDHVGVPRAAGPAEYVGIGTFIDQREGYRGGRPFIVGTGVTVDRISVLHRIDGLTPEEIGEEMRLTPPQVMAALTF